MSGEEQQEQVLAHCTICSTDCDSARFLRCCLKGHAIHKACFKAMHLHYCPECNGPLLVTPHDLFVAMLKDSSNDPVRWGAIRSSLERFRSKMNRELKAQDWSEAFCHILIVCSAAHLKNFLDLGLVDVNQKIFENGPEFALARLLILYRDASGNPKLLERIHQKIQVLLDRPEIRLNRKVHRYDNSHLIELALKFGPFDVFPVFLAACPKYDLPALFRLAAKLPHRPEFFNYLLDLGNQGVFDIFAPDKDGLSALSFACRSDSPSYGLALLASPKLRTGRLRIESTSSRLLWFVIENGLFDIFLHILAESPRLHLPALFREVCENKSPYNFLFFHHLLTRETFDIFEADRRSGRNSLHFALEAGNNSMITVLIASSRLKPKHLRARNSKNNRNVLETAIAVNAGEEIINKLRSLM